MNWKLNTQPKCTHITQGLIPRLLFLVSFSLLQVIKAVGLGTTIILQVIKAVGVGTTIILQVIKAMGLGTTII